MKKIRTRILVIIITLSVVFFGYKVYDFLSFSWLENGCGMDDGPFEAVKIEQIEFSKTAETYKLEKGKLVLDNRHDTLSPILTYIVDNKIKWTLDTDVRNTAGYETSRISSINDLKVQENSNELNLEFYAVWTYGAESGSMNIEKKDGKNSFCLSW